MARIAVPLGPDFEDSEFTVPSQVLTDAGHSITVFGAQANEKVTGKTSPTEVTVETTADELSVGDYDALLIPGGFSPDRLRLHKNVVGFVRDFFQTGKPVAAICHGPQLLIEAGVVEGKTLTSWPSVKVDLINAGANWVDEEVVVDGNLITSRKPDDLNAFCNALQEKLAA